MKRYHIDITLGKQSTRIYLEIIGNENLTLFPEDDETGNPARLEIGGNIALEFEGEVTYSLV